MLAGSDGVARSVSPFPNEDATWDDAARRCIPNGGNGATWVDFSCLHLADALLADGCIVVRTSMH